MRRALQSFGSRFAQVLCALFLPGILRALNGDRVACHLHDGGTLIQQDAARLSAELQRRIETEAIGIASLLVSVLYFAGGLLQLAEVIEIAAGVAMIWVFPLLCASYGIAKIVLTRRYL